MSAMLPSLGDPHPHRGWRCCFRDPRLRPQAASTSEEIGFQSPDLIADLNRQQILTDEIRRNTTTPAPRAGVLKG